MSANEWILAPAEILFDISSSTHTIQDVEINLRCYKKEPSFSEEEYERLMDLKKKLSEAETIALSMYSFVEFDWDRSDPPDY